MGNQDQTPAVNPNTPNQDNSLGAALGVPAAASGHLEAATPIAAPAAAPKSPDDFSTPMHPELRKPAAPQTAAPVSASVSGNELTQVVPTSGSAPSFSEAIQKVAETHTASNMTIPKDAPMKAKESLDSLSGRLQSGGGKNIFSDGEIHRPKPIETIAPAKNPMMEELRKQSAENTIVRPIRTYKDDISMLIEKRKTSFVGAVAAEANRRAKTVEATEQQLAPKKRKSIVNYLLIAGAFIFVLIGLGVVGYAYLTRDKGVGTVPASALPKLVFSEHQEVLDITGMNRRTLITVLNGKRTSNNLRLGSIEQYYPTVKGGAGAPRLLTGVEFLKQLDVAIPGTLSRTLAGSMMLGLHGFNGNQYFLILKVNDYERGFAGMLEWEKTIEADLFLPFGITRIQKTALPVTAPTSTPITSASTTATTTKKVDPTAPTTTETVSSVTTDDFIARAFVDIVVKNINARALKRDDGTIALLYAFPDKNTIIIASTESTLIEIISRLQSIRI